MAHRNLFLEGVIRILVALVLLPNALFPTIASASGLSPQAQEQIPVEGNGTGNILQWFGNLETLWLGLQAKPLQQQDATPTVDPGLPPAEPTMTPSITIVPTVISTDTPTSTSPVTATITTSPTLTPVPTSTATQPSTPTSALSPTPTATSQPPTLSFNLSASSQQAAPGDTVLFTIQVTNTGTTDATSLQYSDTLPQAFGSAQDGFQGFNFDPQSRVLSWSGDTQNKTTLPAGQSMTLQYSVRLDPSMKDDIQIVDSALLSADGLTVPLASQAALTVLTPDKQLTAVGTQGGTARGLRGLVQVDLPQNALASNGDILIQDLRSSNPAPSQNPWMSFHLELHSPQVQTSQPQLHEQDTFITFQGGGSAKFSEAVKLTVSLNGLTDLATLGADQAPFLVSLDDASGTWVHMPLNSIDRQANQITAEITHFSTWGVGIGPSFPTNGANVLLFGSAYPALFTGSSGYSIPLWTPPGRNGMAPSLALSYTGAAADGVLGDVQSSWVGMGWSIDTAEIDRKITNSYCNPCGNGSYGYETSFILLLNGTSYDLVRDGTTPGRFHTKMESFLYIQRHNDSLGNNSPAANNATGEWWEVVEKDGTRWRFGFRTDSEQLAAMKGYPGTNSGAWATLGYAGHATDVVAARWRVDRVTDVYGNKMTFSYYEESRGVAGSSATYDRASYIDTITYTAHTSGNPAPGYSVVFVHESRGTNDVPTAPTDWDDWDTYRLNHVDVKYGTTIVRTYALGYTIRSYSDGGASWQTTTLTSLATSGSTTVAPIVNTAAPTVTFTYVDLNNRADDGSGWTKWAYPRLATINNGWGGVSTYTYENDGRPYTSWYNWRVKELDITDGVNASPMKSTFAYSTPCYDDPTAGRCNSSNTGSLIGYAQTTATVLDFDGATVLAKTIHQFYTDQEFYALEYKTQDQDASGTTLHETDTAYSKACTNTDTAKSYFRYATTVDEYVNAAGSLIRASHTVNSYDLTTGNLTMKQDFQVWDLIHPYRQTVYNYTTNTSPSIWILNTLSQRIVQNGNGATVSEQDYGYDHNLGGIGSPVTTKPTLMRVVNGTQTMDTGYVYDAYGNLTEKHVYKAYGSTAYLPNPIDPYPPMYLTYTTGYDAALQTYPVSQGTPLIPVTTTGYDYGLGLPTTVTDPNNNTTTTAYDGLGRAASVTDPGFSQANVMYTYPTPSGSPLSVSAPFSIRMDFWDQSASPAQYRSTWQVLDGLDRVIQTQSPYYSSRLLGGASVSDISYNAQGLTLYSGLPRFVNTNSYPGSGNYFAPTWAGIPHTTTSYDALERKTAVAYPDGSQESFSYSGFNTTTIDRNGHQKAQQVDEFGRLVTVYEYTGSNPYTLYASAAYRYDERDLLKSVIDAAGNQTTMTYDGFGNKTSMTDPDLGTWNYSYNVSADNVYGNLHVQTDARGCSITIIYDALNRPTRKTYSGPGACATTPEVDYTYDSTAGGNQGLGHRTGMTVDPNNQGPATTWTYNVLVLLGQVTNQAYIVTNQTQAIDGTNYSLGTNLDAFRRPLTQNLPGTTETLTYGYNAMGELSSLTGGTSTYVSQMNYDVAGNLTDEQLGNTGMTEQFCHDANTLRLTGLRTYSGTLQDCGTTPSNAVLNLSYTYQPNGNISQLTDATRNETINYTYDELDRLIGASGPYSQGYTYDAVGNIQTTGSPTKTYSYGDSAHKHAVTALSTGESYQYDADGNMTCRVEGGNTYIQTFNAENRMSQAQQVSGTCAVPGTVIAQWSFIYDGDGNLVKQVNPDGSKTIYIDGVYEEDRDSGGSVTGTRVYYSAGGAMRVNGALYFVLKDNLGSAVVTLDASGNVIGQERYYPFGSTRFSSGSMNTDRLYTGQRNVASLGLMDYHARMYDATLGRFIQPDSIIPPNQGVQGLNRYSYVNNSPVNFTDPTGQKIGCDDGYLGSCKDYAASLSNQVKHDRRSKLNFTGYSKQEQQWLLTLFDNGGPDAQNGVEYILSNGVHITVGTGWQGLGGSVGAWFDQFGNSVTINKDSGGNIDSNGQLTTYALSLLIHEAFHLEQGDALAHSKLGEMEAWQIQYNILAQLGDPAAFAPGWRDIHAAKTLADYSPAVQKYWPGYWKNDHGIGLITYPDYPACFDSLMSCVSTPWLLRVNILP